MKESYKNKNNMEKTLNKVVKVHEFLHKGFHNKIFTYKEIENYLVSNDIHGMHFYYFVYAGVINKVSRGTYQLNQMFYLKDSKQIYDLGKQYLEKLRKNRCSNKKIIDKINISKPIFEITLKESDCINFLKNLGYKIMKPVQQFEEI